MHGNRREIYFTESEVNRLKYNFHVGYLLIIVGKDYNELLHCQSGPTVDVAPRQSKHKPITVISAGDNRQNHDWFKAIAA